MPSVRLSRLAMPMIRFLSPARVLWLGILGLLPSLLDRHGGDLPVYFERLQQSGVPYTEVPFEYPIYARWALLAPLVLDNYRLYRWAIQLSLVACAVLVHRLLARQERAALTTSLWWGMLVLSQAVVMKRFDLWLAAIFVCAYFYMYEKKYTRSGLLLGVGAGLKVVPALLLVPWAAWSRSWRLLLGAAVGLLPALLALLWVPWWRFALFHRDRGLEVESVGANLLWLSHLILGSEVEWNNRPWFVEVAGPAADAFLPVARGLFAVIVLASLGFAAWKAWRDGNTARTLPELSLSVLLAFIVSNVVLSPQYILWLWAVVLAAHACAPLRTEVIWTMCAVSICSFIVYPSASFATGLNLPVSLVLLTRNVLLIGLWVGCLAGGGLVSRRVP